MSETKVSGIELLKELIDRKFWGTVEFSLQDGRVILIRETRTIKPEQNAEWNTKGGERGRTQ